MRSHVEILSGPPVTAGTRARVQILKGAPVPNRSSTTDIRKSGGIIEKGDQMHTRVQFMTPEQASPEAQIHGAGLPTRVEIAAAAPTAHNALPAPQVASVPMQQQDPVARLEAALTRAVDAREEADRNIEALTAAIADYRARAAGAVDAELAQDEDDLETTEDGIQIIDAPSES